MLDIILGQEVMGWNYFHQPKMTKNDLLWQFYRISNAVILYYSRGCAVCDISHIIHMHSVSKCMTSLWGLRWAIAHVHILVSQSNSSFFFFNSRTEIMRRKISCLHQPQIGEMKICLKQRERPPWRLGLQFLSYIPWRFHVTKYRKLLCPSSCHVTPLTHSFFFFLFLLSGCLCCQPIAWHLLSCS